MRIYLQYGAIFIFILWIFILILRFRIANKMSREFGIPVRTILTLGFEKDFLAKDNPRRDKAYMEFKRMQKRTFWTWIIVLLCFFLGFIYIGVTTN